MLNDFRRVFLRRLCIILVVVGMMGVVIGFTTPALGELVKLRYSTWWGGAAGKWIKEVITAFQKEHPDITIKMEIPARAYDTKLLIEFAAGTAPDVMQVQPFWTAEFTYRGIPVDIQPFVERDGLDLTKITPSALLEYQKYWLPATEEKHLYGLPIVQGGFPWVYNRDMYRELGLAFPTWETWTTDRFLSDAKKITRDLDGDGKIDVWAGTSAGWTGLPYMWIPDVYSWGGEIFDEDRRKCLLDSEEAADAWQFYADLINKHHVLPPVTVQPPGIDPWFAGKAAWRSISHGGILMEAIDPGIEFDWGWTTRPAKVKFANFNVTNGLVINSKSKHIEEAWEFVKYFFLVGTTEWTKEYDFCPLLENLDYWKSRNEPPYDMEWMRLDLPNVTYVGKDWLPGAAKSFREMETQHQLVVTGKISAREALAKVAPKVQKWLDEFWKGK